MRNVIWSYGITTVPERCDTLLPRTMLSLAAAGFTNPRVFVDGELPVEKEPDNFVFRYPRVRLVNNWILGMWELYLRNPHATHYAMFQDDILACHGLRDYLSVYNFPEKGYLNLICYPQNMRLCGVNQDGRWIPNKIGWFESNQLGLGAQGLVFDRTGLLNLLRHQDTAMKPLDPINGFKSLDGHILIVMKKLGYKEYVHNPSLLTHAGYSKTTIGGGHPDSQPAIQNYIGEQVDVIKFMEAAREKLVSVQKPVYKLA